MIFFSYRSHLNSFTDSVTPQGTLSPGILLARQHPIVFSFHEVVIDSVKTNIQPTHGLEIGI